MASSDSLAGTAAGVDEDDVGYSLSTGSIAATTIHTSAEGLKTRVTLVDAGDRAIQVNAAWPWDASNAPVMLVVREAFGLHAHIADVVRRFAHRVYFAVAPDLMIRQGDSIGFDDIGNLVRDILIPDRRSCRTSMRQSSGRRRKAVMSGDSPRRDSVGVIARRPITASPASSTPRRQ